MRISTIYTPPAIEGWIFWSHILREGLNGRLVPMNDLGREFAINVAAARFDVPAADVMAVEFTPQDGYNVPQWAVYLRDSHADLLEEFRRNLMDLARTLQMMNDLENEG